MKKANKYLVLIPTLLIFGCSNVLTSNNQNIIDYENSKEESDDQFDFEGNYTIPELTVDGVMDEKEWESACDPITFGSTNQATLRMYRGNSALYCFFDVKDEDLETVGNNNGDDVTNGDSVEVYFDFKNDASKKPNSDDIQINIGAHGKTRIFVGSNGQWGSWNGLLDYEIKLNGTLNDDSDVDTSYQVELMIPYAQVGIDKNSTFGFSVGHVARGKDSTNPDLDYTWGGLVYEGTFIDPQVPESYLVLQGNKVYSRDNLPMDNVNINGTIKDQLGNVVENVEIKIDEEIAKTDAKGKYSFSNIDPNVEHTLTISKEGYKTIEKTLLPDDLKSGSSNIALNYILINESITAKTTLQGTIKNPSEGNIANANIAVNGVKTTSDSEGKFSLEITIDNDLSLEISKENYKTYTKVLDASIMINDGITNLGVVELYSPSSSFTFGGARGISKVEAEVYRGFEGFNFTFKTEKAVTNGDHVELFIDTGSSFSGRDTSDYRIDFKGDGGISIVNFGDGNNNIVSSSGIKNNAYLKGTTYYMDTFIPYSFLGVASDEIIGISAGMWSESLKDWDGWSFAGEGFEDYVAPEYTDRYCRIGLDNGLYRAKDNNTYATKVYGKIVDSNGNALANATINSKSINNDGTFAIWLINNTSTQLTISCSGYLNKTIDLAKEDLNGQALKLDITLSLAQAVIQGSCNVNGAKVYLEADPNTYTIVENNTYSLKVPTGKNVYLIFEADGYKTVRKAFGAASINQSAEQNLPITFNCVMSNN